MFISDLLASTHSTVTPCHTFKKPNKGKPPVLKTVKVLLKKATELTKIAETMAGAE